MLLWQNFPLAKMNNLRQIPSFSGTLSILALQVDVHLLHHLIQLIHAISTLVWKLNFMASLLELFFILHVYLFFHFLSSMYLCNPVSALESIIYPLSPLSSSFSVVCLWLQVRCIWHASQRTCGWGRRWWSWTQPLPLWSTLTLATLRLSPERSKATHPCPQVLEIRWLFVSCQ